MNTPSLFDLAPLETNETLDDVYQELLEKGKQIFPERFFIFGTGNRASDVVIVGESPGPPDAESEKPFQGPTGELLTKILASISIKRDDVFLTNVVKFISTGDEITPDVLNFFAPYLHREIAVIHPKVIIALGNTPTRSLLNTKKPISQVRGEFRDYFDMKVMPTFNPAYLLRDPTKKREVWEDMKQVRDYLAEKN
jgi:uracil-DNA glycosylase